MGYRYNTFLYSYTLHLTALTRVRESKRQGTEAWAGCAEFIGTQWNGVDI